jgi:hypothetical protein
MSRILGIIAILVGLALGISWYIHRAKTRAMNSGEVFVREQPGDNAKPQPNATPTTPPSPPQEIATTGPPQTQQPGLEIPTSDTISRNPPNGMAFAGSGKYQLYRQGDITWRLDTDTGWACVLFATDTQWSKARVYQSGCANSGEAHSATGN